MTDAELIDRMVDIVGPCMGAAMARASLKVYINEVKVRHGSFSVFHLHEVVARLQKGLEAFVGQEQAQLLSEQILALRSGRARAG